MLSSAEVTIPLTFTVVCAIAAALHRMQIKRLTINLPNLFIKEILNFVYNKLLRLGSAFKKTGANFNKINKNNKRFLNFKIPIPGPANAYFSAFSYIF
jgi:hypothetical protein